MSILKRHNPVLERRLQAYLAADDIQGLRSFLEGLSNQDFRTAGFLLGEKLLPKLANSPTVFLELFPCSGFFQLKTLSWHLSQSCHYALFRRSVQT